jgi:hypothetical protein
MFNSLPYEAYVIYISIQICRILDPLKILYVLLMPISLHFILSIVFISKVHLDEFALCNFNTCAA